MKQLCLVILLLYCCFLHQAKPASRKVCRRTNKSPFRFCTDACDGSRKGCGKDELCRCDGDCGYSCVPKGLNCGKPRSIRNGRMRFNHTRFNGVVTYSCRKPYTLTGTQKQRCSAIREWTGTQARCRIMCPDPGEVKNGVKFGSRYRQGDMIIYRCLPGFELHGGNVLKCIKGRSKGRWNATKPTCEVTSCPRPPPSPTMEIFRPSRLPKRFTFMYRVLYRCRAGYYKLKGFPTRECLINGWSNITLVCKPKTCGDPKTPLNGRKSGYEYTFKKRIYYTCNDGYKLVGSKYRQCQANSEWGGSLPKCEVTDCGYPPAPADGKIISLTKTTYQGEVVFECDKAGYELKGSKNRRCLTNGTWSGTPSSCEPVNCGDPGTPSNGDQISGKNDYSFPGSVTFACRANYTLIGTQRIFCQANKTWNGPLPQCAGPCPDPGHPVDGTTVGNVFTHEQTVSFTCSRGLILEGAKSSTCRNGSWSNDVPKCDKRCTDPGEPDNGVRRDHNFTFGQIVRFRCNAHFSRQGARAIRCVDGAWDEPTPRCSQCADDLVSENNKLAHWKFSGAKLITRLGLAMEANARNCDLYWRINISAPGRWPVYSGDDGQDKIITIGAGGTLEMSFKKPFVARGVKFKCAGSLIPDLKSVSLRGCDGISDCVLVGSKVWVKTRVLDKRSVYEQKTVIGIHVNNGTVEAKVSLGGRKKYMKEIIPDIPASRNVLTAGTRVIAKDDGIFYGGTVLREVNRGAGEWQIESQGDVWSSRLDDIRIVEPPQYCN